MWVPVDKAFTPSPDFDSFVERFPGENWEIILSFLSFCAILEGQNASTAYPMQGR